MATSESIEKETTFTKGPLIADGSVVYVDSGIQPWVADFMGFPDSAANAQLFAAAPELYEALTLITPEFVALLLHAESSAAIAEYSDNDREIIAKCQAALAKARGEDRSHEGK